MNPNLYGIEGRKPTENRDCVVRALTVAANIPYEIAWLATAIKGRRKGCGMYAEDWLPAFKANGLCNDADKLDYVDIKLLELKGKLDNVIICIKGHLFAIRNGTHSDGVGRKPVINKSNFAIAWRIR